MKGNLKKNNILLLFLFFAKIAFGQDSLNDNKLCLKVAPLAIFDIYNGMAPRVGIEYKLIHNYSLYHEIGTYIPNVNSMNSNQGIILRTEFKRYLNRSSVSSGNYLSIELFYKYQQYNTNDSIRSAINYTRDYSVFKSVGCFNVKYGSMKIYKFNMIVEYFISLGLRYKVTRSNLSQQENDNLVSTDDSYNINLLVNRAGTFLFPNVDAGIKIGYKLK